MSVVPLLRENGATVATTPEAFEVAGGALDGEAVLILDIDQQQIADRSSSNVCYDLRIGKEYRNHRDRGKHALPEKGTLKLAPGAAVIVETEESVHLPRRFFALVVPKVGVLQRGLSNTMSKVDPDTVVAFWSRSSIWARGPSPSSATNVSVRYVSCA